MAKYDYLIRKREFRDTVYKTLSIDNIRSATKKFIERLVTGDPDAFETFLKMNGMIGGKQQVEFAGAHDENGRVVFTLKIGEKDLTEDDDNGGEIRGELPQTAPVREAAGVCGFDLPVHGGRGQH